MLRTAHRIQLIVESAQRRSEQNSKHHPPPNHHQDVQNSIACTAPRRISTGKHRMHSVRQIRIGSIKTAQSTRPIAKSAQGGVIPAQRAQLIAEINRFVWIVPQRPLRCMPSAGIRCTNHDGPVMCHITVARVTIHTLFILLLIMNTPKHTAH